MTATERDPVTPPHNAAEAATAYAPGWITFSNSVPLIPNGKRKAAHSPKNLPKPAPNMKRGTMRPPGTGTVEAKAIVKKFETKKRKVLTKILV